VTWRLNLTVKRAQSLHGKRRVGYFKKQKPQEKENCSSFISGKWMPLVEKIAQAVQSLGIG
jgi:hypothetical protein